VGAGERGAGSPDGRQLAAFGPRFRPLGQHDLAPPGAVAKIRANLAALSVLRDIQRNPRPATPGEQAILARWSGWGAVPEVFDDRQQKYSDARRELASLLTPAELAAAARNTLNAHYTDAALVKTIWPGVQLLGFTGGRVLEPGCGSGTFIGFAPEGAEVTGIELEPVTAQIAALLYPDAGIRNESFADTRLSEGFFDLAIGNVPFGAIRLTDRTWNPNGHAIHNHFIIKALRLTRPGGMVAVLTSRYTMDARNPGARREMAALADLVAAFRLPGGAHQQAAGTRVVTDLLILHRRPAGRDPDPTCWEQAPLTDLGGTWLPVNEYFQAHPEYVLGEMSAGHGAYRGGDLVVTGDHAAPALLAVLARLPAEARARGLTWTPAPAGSPGTTASRPRPAAAGRPDGYLSADLDGTFTRVENGLAVPCRVPRTQAAELRQLLRLRDSVLTLLDAEAGSLDDTPELDRLRQDLGRRYDSYAGQYGPVNRFSWRRTGRLDPATGAEKLARTAPPQGGFRTDPYAPVVLALEEFDPATQHAARAAIFTRRVVAPRNPRLGADSPADALAICLDACGEVRLPAIARLLGTSQDQARAELGTLIFDDPQSGRLVPAAEYLSGMVRDKLKTARLAAADDARYDVNAEHLTRVIPADLTPAEIDARLGAAWIDVSYVRQFLRETLDDPKIEVEHPGGQVWSVQGGRRSVLATSTWGTARYPAPHLAQAMLEQRRIEVRDKTPDDAWVLNLDETIAAQEKAAELAARFGEWAWEDPARATELAAVYNDKLNGIVLRNYDDTVLTLPGLALSFEPRPHQVAAVARIICEPAVGLFHEVGAGKTAEMTMGAMELRRLHLARKPAIIVPNHMLEQFGREFLQLYPQARVLIAQRDDLQAARRHLFAARCATGDWDAVIMSRSAFERIPLSPAVQRAYLQREVNRIKEWIRQSHGSGSRTVKRLEAAALRAEERIKAKLDGAKDPGITFEATGIDYLFADEAHGYKNLRTSSNIPDAAIDGSMRASDLDMKIQYLRERNGNRVVTFATATPIANSITEAWVMQHYLRPDLLEAAGVDEFDSWAATFAQTVTQIELAPEGGSSFRQKTRFAKFVNVPEQMRMLHVAADIKTGDDLDLPAPALARRPGDGQRTPEIVLVQPTQTLLGYVAELGERADQIRSRAVPPELDNMLKVSTDGRKAALDLRLVGLPMTQPGKIDIAATRIAAIWAAHRDDIYPAADGGDSAVRGSLQIVFSDLGTPSDRWNVYDELRAQLVRRGLPREAIRFIHDARTDREKGELFAACRAGTVAVLIGSTEKMGVGTNVQARAVALHHLDCPWRPADVAQREGRILRQGNHNAEVQILRYVTERSFDGYLFQAVERKARFIAQVMRGRLDVREIEDIGDAALSYNEVKALATGNPLLMDKAEADAELTRLLRAERAHHRNLDALRYKITAAERRTEHLTALIATTDAAIARRRDTRGDAFTMTIDGTRHTQRADAGRHLKHQLERQLAGVPYTSNEPQQHGQLGGFDVISTARRVLATREVVLTLHGAPEADIRLSPDELADTDPARLVIRLENRLHALEAVKTKAFKEILDLKAEAARAREDLARPFPSARQLTETRERVARLDQQLTDAARPQHEEPASSRAATTPAMPEPVSIAGRNFPDRQATARQNPGPPARTNVPASEREARWARPVSKTLSAHAWWCFWARATFSIAASRHWSSRSFSMRMSQRHWRVSMRRVRSPADSPEISARSMSASAWANLASA
jgi:N12 class adenine-specific DNA methylase/SAM-dependent methyltransferase